MHEYPQVLGKVDKGRFVPEHEEGALSLPVRLTGISMHASVPPESEELSLHPHQGKTLLVSGHPSGGWIYSATIIEVREE